MARRKESAGFPGSQVELPAIPPGVTVRTLAHGLTVIVREDHNAPVASVQVWCKTGSIHEGHWLGGGISHVLEHMLFKGTTTRGSGRIDQEVQAAGGYMNAYTGFDRTVYFINVPNTGTAVAIDILSDIVQNATLPEEELAKELDVIRREMDMSEDEPGRRSSRRLFETAYTLSPYRYPIIGYRDIFDTLRTEDIRAYYRSRYVPNNLFFVVVGSVDTQVVVDQIEQCFKQAKARSVPPPALPREPRQTAPRQQIEEGPIELGYLHLSWHVPEIRHPDTPLLDVLASLLGNGRSSRLYQAIRERAGLVHTIDAWTYNPGDPGLLGISAVVDADKFEAAREAMIAEVRRVQDEPVGIEELGKAIKQFTAATLAIRKTVQGQAQDLGSSWLAADDLNFSHRYLEAVRQSTPQEIQRVARQYLTAENRTLYALLPSGTRPRLAVEPSASMDQAIRKFTLPNGLRLLVKEDHRLPFVEFRTVFQGGVLAESARLSGATLLLAKMLLKGTPTRSAEQIAQEIESVGGMLDSYCGNNSLGMQCEVLREDVPLALDLLADTLLQPAFPESAFAREREIQLAALKAQRDHLLHNAFRAMRRSLFGDQGYGLDILGAEESIKRLQLSDLTQLHRSLILPNNCVVAIYGDVAVTEICAEVERIFGRWAVGPAPSLLTAGPVAAEQVRLSVEARDKKQAVVVIGFPGSTLHNEDRYALELLQETCSDLGSRLFLRIREKLGLAYYVGAQNFLGLSSGYFAFYAGTAPETSEQVAAELLQEAAALQNEPLGVEELQRAKAKFVGQKKIARQDLGALAMVTALDELYGLGYQHVDEEDALYEAVTPEQVQEAARRYLDPSRCVIVTLQSQPAALGQ